MSLKYMVLVHSSLYSSIEKKNTLRQAVIAAFVNLEQAKLWAEERSKTGVTLIVADLGGRKLAQYDAKEEIDGK